MVRELCKSESFQFPGLRKTEIQIQLNCYNEVIRGEDFTTQGDVLLMEPGSVPWF